MSGFIKIHRKMLEWEWYQDGNVFRVFMHCLLKANWKEGRYQGHDIPRGSFNITIGDLARETSLTVQQVRTAINKLKSTNEITSKTTNAFTIISIVNYDLYQGEQQANQQTDNKRITNEQQTDNKPSYNVEERKKERREEYNTPLPPTGESEGVVEFPMPKKTDCPSKGNPEWPAFLSCWEVYPVKQGQEQAWREWMRLKKNGTLAQAWEIRDAILTLEAQDERWRKGMVPSFTNWLQGKRWNDQPYNGQPKAEYNELMGY